MSLGGKSSSATDTRTTTTMTDLTSRSSFKGFLERKIDWSNISNSPKSSAVDVNVVMGNEAGDADSIISALALAYVMDRWKSATSGEDVTIAPTVMLPLVSIPRADMALRRDVCLLLGDLCGIDVNALHYLDDIDVQNLLTAKDDSAVDVKLTLTDHNVARNQLSHLASKVALILDHHDDQHQHTHLTTTSSMFPDRDIAFQDGKATVASTCTLVTERLLHRYNGENDEQLDPDLALALLAVILLDSINLQESAGKVTDRDRYAVADLVAKTRWKALEHHPKMFEISSSTAALVLPNLSSLFHTLSGAKFDPQFWHDMTTVDCLRIDYKRFQQPTTTADVRNLTSFGLSSVLLPISSLCQKPHFLHDATLYMEKMNNEDDNAISFLGIMSSVMTDKGPRRELLIIGKDTSPMIEHLLTKASFLQLQEDSALCADSKDDIAKLYSANRITVRSFKQLNSKASRKQLAPVMMTYFEDTSQA